MGNVRTIIRGPGNVALIPLCAKLISYPGELLHNQGVVRALADLEANDTSAKIEAFQPVSDDTQAGLGDRRILAKNG